LPVRCFFTSRGRHTRFSRDWSSDVCSSDLERYFPWLWSVEEPIDHDAALLQWARILRDDAWRVLREVGEAMPLHAGQKYKAWVRSEERRVGKEGGRAERTEDGSDKTHERAS